MCRPHPQRSVATVDELRSSGRTLTRLCELEWDPNADTTSLGALGRALKGGLEKPRYVRSMQWSAVWNRYVPAAVAMEQLT